MSVALFVLTLLSLSVASAELYNLTVLHTTDVRGRVLPITTTLADCTVAQAKKDNGPDCYGGFSRQLTYIRSVRASRNHTLLVDGGNYYYGTLFFSTFQGTANANYFTQAGYDAWIPGTNEFFFGPALFASYIGFLGSAIPSPIGTNLNWDDDAALGRNRSRTNGQPYLSPWQVKEIGGRYVGVLGYVQGTLQASSSPGPNIKVSTDAAPLLNRAITQIKAQYPSCNIFVLLGQLTDSELKDIATYVFDLDVIILQSAQADTVATYPHNGPSPFTPQSAYPSVRVSSFGKKVIVAEGGLYGVLLGDLQISFDDDGDIVDFSGNTQLLTNQTAYEPVSWQEIQDKIPEIEQVSNRVVGFTNVDIYGSAGSPTETWGCRWADCPMGHFINDALLTACPDCQVAYFNGGGIRASILKTTRPGGNITRGDVTRVSPFQNTMATMTLRGDVLAEVIRFGLKTQNGGAYLQVGGVRIAFNYKTGQFVSIQVQNRISGLYEALNVRDYYKIVTNNYLALGGNNYNTVWKDIGPPINVNTLLRPVEEVIWSYLGNMPNGYSGYDLSQMRVCSNTSYTLQYDGPDPVWPVPQCHVVPSDGLVDLLTVCQSNTEFCSASAGGYAYEGQFVNRSSCNTCSGLGTCHLRQCVCAPPTTTGLFAGVQMVRGPDCSELRTEETLHPAFAGFLYFLSGATIALAVASSVYYLTQRKTKIIVRSSPRFLHLINFGAILGAISCMLIINHRTSSYCELNSWLANLAFIVVFGSLFAKTYRLYRIFTSKSLRVITFNDAVLGLLLLGLVVIEVAIQSARAGASPHYQMITPNSSSWTYFRACGSEHKSLFIYLAVGYKAILVLWGVFLAFEIKDIHRDYNESKVLGIVIYNLSFTSLVLLFLVYLITPYSDAPTPTAIYIVGANYILIFTVLGMVIPKIFHRSVTDVEDMNQTTQGSAIKTLKHMGSTSPQQAVNFNEALLQLEMAFSRCQQSIRKLVGSERADAKSRLLNTLHTNITRLDEDDNGQKLDPNQLFSRLVSLPAQVNGDLPAGLSSIRVKDSDTVVTASARDCKEGENQDGAVDRRSIDSIRVYLPSQADVDAE